MSALPSYMDWPPIRRWYERLERDGRAEEAEQRVAAWRAMVDEGGGVVRWERDGKIGRITLSYPAKGNAFVPPMYGLLYQAITDLAEDDSVWVILLTAAGKNFSTGGYVGPHAFYSGLDSGEDGTRTEPMRRTFKEMFQAPVKALYECEKPTVVALNGPVMGEGVDLALAGDIRIGSDASDIWFSAAFSGNTVYAGTGYLLPRMVGLARAKRLLFTAQRLSGREAADLGLITDLVPASELLTRADELCHTIAALPPITLRLIKAELHRGLEVGSYASSLDLFSMIETIVQTTDDHMRAEEAIARKEKPTVIGG